jgi:very-short-patch-repair endonuclease
MKGRKQVGLDNKTQHFNKKSEQEKRRKLRKEMTYCERIVWIHLKKKQLGYRFLRQYSVDHYVIDFYCPKLKLTVEIDGDVHDLPDQKRYDAKRQKYLETFRIKFVRVTNEEFLGNPDKAFRKIEDKIKLFENELK